MVKGLINSAVNVVFDTIWVRKKFRHIYSSEHVLAADACTNMILEK